MNFKTLPSTSKQSIWWLDSGITGAGAGGITLLFGETVIVDQGNLSMCEVISALMSLMCKLPEIKLL